ncbi:MAG TPA: glycoside hydrolase family protein [Candidatus Binatia bacterium]|nr:glycoside hydrolase family protein [Candidatus Binatia bacterium]
MPAPTIRGYCGILLLLGFLTACGLSAAPKKGVGAWYFPSVNRALVDVNVSWYYTWQPHTMQISRPDGVEFVPMIWDETFVKPNELELAKESGSVLLGFNEPDGADQANMTVEEALNLWPQLMATGLRLGSPAPAANPSLPGSWLERFMMGARARGYRVDFLAVHWYGDKFDVDEAVNGLKDFLEAVYHKYQLPIWLTEYGLIRWSEPPVFPSWEQQAEFAAKSVEMLERLPFVERYAWFSLPPSTKDGSDTTALYDQNGEPTPVGIAYRKAGLKLGRFSSAPLSTNPNTKPKP